MPAFGPTRRLLAVAMLAGCSPAALARDASRLDATEAPALARFEDGRALGGYLRRLTRARAHRSTPPVDLATLFWFGVRTPTGVSAGARGWGHDAAGPAKALGDHLMAVQCGELAAVDLAAGGVATANRAEPNVRYHGLLTRGDTLVALGTTPPRRGRYLDADDGVEFVHTFASAGGEPTPLGAVELRTGGRAAAGLGHTRIVEDTLVLVRRVRLDRGGRMPAVRDGARPSAWRPLLAPQDVVRPAVHGGVLHLVIRCALDELPGSCRAHGVLGEFATTMHGPDATYLWMIEGAAGPERPHPRHAIVRLPHDGSPITAVRVPGMPLGGDAWRVRDDGSIDAVVAIPRLPRNVFADDIALLRIEAAQLERGLSTVTASTPLTGTHLDGALALRFVGDTLVYADRPRADCTGPTALRLRALDDGTTTALTVPGCVDVIDAGPDGLLLGDWTTAREHVRLWAVAMGPAPSLGDSLDLRDAWPPYLGPLGPRAATIDGEALWVIPVATRGPRTAPRVRVLAQQGTGLRERSVRTRAVVDRRRPCPGAYRPPTAFVHDDRLFASLPDGLVELEISGPR